MLNDLYRKEAKIGSGSTAAAIRYETETGLPVGGKFHRRKGESYLNALSKWLRKYPDAADSDRRIAQNVIDDLIDALGSN